MLCRYSSSLTTAHNYWKDHSLNYMELCWGFVGKVTSLLFNTLSRALVTQLVRIFLQCGRPAVFWPGEFHGQYSPWGCKESDTTERLSLTRFVTAFQPRSNHLISWLCSTWHFSSLTSDWTRALTVKVPSPNHWTTRKFPVHRFLTAPKPWWLSQ